MQTLIRHQPFLPHISSLRDACQPATRPGAIERMTLAMVVTGIVVGAAGVARALLAG